MKSNTGYESVDYHPGRFKRLGRKIAWLFGVYLRPRHDAVVLTRNGLLSFDSKDKTTGRILHVYRNHEFDEMMQVVDFLRSQGILTAACDGTVVDVGGYLGMSSTAFLLENVFEHSLTFEPHPENFRLLQKNVAHNGLENRLQAFNMALSDASGELEFELSEKNYGDHRVRNAGQSAVGHFGEEQRQVIKVPAMRFDDFLAQHPEIDQDRIRFIWMDIQGHEGRFLKGAQEFLMRHPNVPVMMEFWPYAINRSGLREQEFVELCQSRFNSFVVIGEGKQKIEDIAGLGAYFEEHKDPEGGSAIMLMNRGFCA